MSAGHCFISYSNADSLVFATKLATELESGQPFIKVWFDKNEMSSSGRDWDEQIASAIGNCKCLLFVMSEDSTGTGSNCKEEWTWALKCKKPVLCLVINKNAVEQFRLNNRQKIYFNSNYDAGIAQLRKAIARIDAPEGELDELNYRLADAKRDLHRANEEDKSRIQAEVDDLKKQIETQQRIVDDPKAAEEQTQKNIEAGLERERQPENPVAAKTETKFINPPPALAPNYFQDRVVETRQIFNFLNNDAQRLMTVVGRGGVGKTTMVCRLLKGLEGGELPDGLGMMRVEGIVYLSESGSHRVNFANIFYDLCKLLPTDTAGELDAVYKNPQANTESKTGALLDRFSGGLVVLLLDNFETLVDTETFDIRDAELDEALRAFLNGTHTAVNIVITTRTPPKALNLTQPGRQRALDLDKGLEPKYAKEMLRDMDTDGKLGLKKAKAKLLNRAYERTLGYPRALEALFAILASDRYTTLEELLAMPTPENVVEALVGEAFNRLDVNAQKVMQALAVYNRPVIPAAVDYLLAPHLPAIDSAPILQRLANMHFARKESGRFYLHPVDREFAFDLIHFDNLTPKNTKAQMEESKKVGTAKFKVDVLPVADEEEAKKAAEGLKKLIAELKEYPADSAPVRSNTFNQHDLTLRAADYFVEARKPRYEWKKLDDLSAQLAEFDLRCAAGDYDSAADVLSDIDFDYLLRWGHYRLLIELRQKIAGQIDDNGLQMSNWNMLGAAYYSMGQFGSAIENWEQGLPFAKDSNDREAEGAFLGNLGVAYTGLGDSRKAIEFLEQALTIDREIGNRSGEGAALGNLGNAYHSLGEVRKAIEFYEQALAISREIGDRELEGNQLGNLGNRYTELGDANKAIEFYEQVMVIFREISKRSGESIGHVVLGNAWSSISEYQQSEENYHKALQIADEISFSTAQQEARWGLAQIYLFQNNLTNARATIEAALQYDVPENNHKAIALQGIISLRQGERETAQGAFINTIAQAEEILAKTPDYYDALDAKGLALCGLALCDGKQHIPTAIETFRAARKIAPHAGIVKSVLRLFDELVKCDEKGVLAEVRKAAEGSDQT